MTVPVLWIRISFNADPDPALYLKADPDTYPDPYQTFKSKKVEFLHEKVGQKSYIRRYKSLFERKKTRFDHKFWTISMLLDPIRISDPYQIHIEIKSWIRICI
jgi:hypothetical protein